MDSMPSMHISHYPGLRKKNHFRRCFKNRTVWKGTIGVAITILVVCLFWNINVKSSINNSKEHQNDIQVFEMKAGKALPSHLDIFNVELNLNSNGFHGIDHVHKKGLIHFGSWMHIIDTSLSNNPRILLLKRGKDLVTCPSSWGLIGEHTYRDEPPLATARRGLKEELGSRFLDHVDVHGSLRNLTEFPVYYERDYGITSGHRIDRQVTWIWLVEMNLDQLRRENADLLLELDDEVADHVWKDLVEYERWIESDVLLKDFCHDTIRSLGLLGLERLKILAKSSTRTVE